MRPTRVDDHSARPFSAVLAKWLPRCTCSSLLAASAVFLGPTHAACARPDPNSASYATCCDDEDEEDKWIEAFLQFLRRLYQILGGDPSKLGSTPNAAMATVTIDVGLYGVPDDLTPEEVDTVLADISTLSTMLQSPPASVSDPTGFMAVLAEIASMLQ